jgi:hypothetical protein
MKQLLVDYSPFKYDINESISDTNGKFIVQGVLQRADQPNQNERVYPKSLLEREVKRYIDNEVAQNRALGELDHPESSVVNLRNVSHNVLKIWWDGNDVCGQVEILNTPSGNILKSLFKSGITLGISSRGMGSLKQIGENTSEVQSDFSLVCWDFVSNPSTHGAFLSPINPMPNMYESVQTKVNRHDEKTHTLIRDIICELSGVCCIR